MIKKKEAAKNRSLIVESFPLAQVTEKKSNKVKLVPENT